MNFLDPSHCQSLTDCFCSKAYPLQLMLNNAWYMMRFSDFKVSLVINAGDCIPTEVFIFSMADDACKYHVIEIFPFIFSLTVTVSCIVLNCPKL